MRFGLSDLEELPSLKEFEALAREALGSDEGLVPVDESLTNEASIGGAQEVAEGQNEAVASKEGMSEGESQSSKKAAAATE
jgi:hypothetical protein